MNLKWRYILFGSLFFVSYALILVEVLHQNKWMFLVGEVLLVGIVILFVVLYNQLLRPIHTLSSGISLLREKNFSTYLKKVGQPEVDAIVDVYNQMVNELRQERLAKEEQNHFLDLLLKASPVGIIILDTEGRVMQANPAAMHQLEVQNINDLEGKNLNRINHPLARELAAITNPQSGIIQLDGVNLYQVHRKYFMDRGFQRPFYIIEELTREWLRFEKKSYEKVIRMMSHEVNNTVGSINSVLGSLSGYHQNSHDDSSRDIREAIEASIERNKNLNTFMANYASVVKLPDPNPTNIDLNQLAERVLLLFEGRFHENFISVETQFHPDRPHVSADRPQMEQVLVNVLKNSMEAIEGDGVIQVKTSARPAAISIRDNGKGIPDGSKNKIFTPFYSEKKHGQGIGLTLIREVLLAHNFYFSLTSDHDGWTEFTIRFD